MTTPRDTPQRRRREAVGAWLTACALILAFGLLSGIVPAFHANLLALVAGTFLLVPGWFIPRDEPGPEAYGMTFRGAPRGIAIGLAAAAITLVGFIPVWHLWITGVDGRTADIDTSAWRQFPERARGAPTEPLADHVNVWVDADLVHVSLSAANLPIRVTVSTDGVMRRTGAPLRPLEQFDLEADAGTQRTAIFSTRGATRITITGDIGGRSLESDDIAIGAGSRTPRAAWLVDTGVALPLDHRWLALTLLLQLLLIALPEEFFFRGYMQRRLAEGSPPRRFGIGPFYVTPTILLVSIAFALTHLIITPWPTRLAVFFPSLVFGWLRETTDGLAAPVTYHAACNMMVVLAAPMYLP